jgi:hypothetical protein
MKTAVAITLADKVTGEMRGCIVLPEFSVEELYNLYGLDFSKEFLDVELSEDDLKFLVSQKIIEDTEFFKYKCYIGVVAV